MTGTWDSETAGLLTLPSGRSVRGRGLKSALDNIDEPDFGLYLTREPPASTTWPSGWIRWPDFWLPTDSEVARMALVDAWHRAADERVEVACWGGLGRTGTAMACLAVIDGVPPPAAVDFVRRNYHSKAVETPWQKRFVLRFTGR